MALLLACVAWGLAAAELAKEPLCEHCDRHDDLQDEGMASLQLRAGAAQGNAAGGLATSRDLGTAGPQKALHFPMQDVPGAKTVPIWFLGAVPSFANESSFMAILLQYSSTAWQHLQEAPVFCSGPGGQHRTRVRFFGGEQADVVYKNVMVLQCDWPQEEASLGTYDVFLDVDGRGAGQVQANYQPGLLKNYGTVACVQPLWHGDAPTMMMLPPWLEFNHLHGVEHFLIYTKTSTDPALLKIYEPYLAAGLATRVHLASYRRDMYDAEDYRTQLWAMNDCLYRARGHAQWLMPSIDVDEYVRLAPGSTRGDFLKRAWDEISSKYGQEVNSISLDRLNFPVRLDDETLLPISAAHRVPRVLGFGKYLVRPMLVHALFVHWPTSWSNGTIGATLKEYEGFINHYRRNSSDPGGNWLEANISDATLVADVPVLTRALETRYSRRWTQLAEELRDKKN